MNHPNDRVPIPNGGNKPVSHLKIRAIFAVVFIIAAIGAVVGMVAVNRRLREAEDQPTASIGRVPGETETVSVGRTPTSLLAADTPDTVYLTDEIDCDYAVLIDLEDNTVLAKKNADRRMYPASMTKVMTLIVACESVTDLNDTYRFSASMLDPLYEAGASMAGFSAGEPVTVRDLLYGAILPSGADGTAALADYVAGGEAAFAEKMNRKAAELGLTATHFVNASGLHDDDHYSTAREMAVILAYAMQNELCREVLSTYRYTTEPTPFHPDGLALESTMFGRLYGDEPDGVEILAGKTGYTEEGGHCLVSYGEGDPEDGGRAGARYLCVTAHGDTMWKPVFDSIRLYTDFAR